MKSGHGQIMNDLAKLVGIFVVLKKHRKQLVCPLKALPDLQHVHWCSCAHRIISALEGVSDDLKDQLLRQLKGDYARLGLDDFLGAVDNARQALLADGHEQTIMQVA